MLREDLAPGQWEYISRHCIVKMGTAGVLITYECEACSNKNLRFIHTLEHLENGSLIQVGIECACVLMESEIPMLAENETKRKERWRREKYRKPGRCVTTIDDLIERGKL